MLADLRFRHEPVYGKDYVTKAQHIARSFFMDRADIIPSDRIIDEGDGKIYVVAGVPDFDDSL